jgi:NAD(P)-dependent dehydrogenase (short-subunit alcohol dehydrogenase family)
MTPTSMTAKEFLAKMEALEKGKRKECERTALGRVRQPEEGRGLFDFLLGDESAHVTGATYSTDAGGSDDIWLMDFSPGLQKIAQGMRLQLLVLPSK